MPLVKIKQLHERVATMGLHLGGDARRRKLEPGEILDVPYEMMEGDENLFDLLWATGTLDLVPETEQPTRPMEYDNYREAKLCSPTFKAISSTDEREMNKARDKYAARLLESATPVTPDSPVAVAPKPKRKAKPKKSAVKTAANRRSQRRQNREAAEHGEANTT